jgi:hypothetical protein
MDRRLEEARRSVDQLSAVICWMTEQVATRDGTSLSEAATALAAEAPAGHVRQTLEVAASAFRGRGL